MNFLYNIIMNKNLSRFLQIHLQLAGIGAEKTCLEHENVEIEK